KFRFCGEADCPDWILAEINTLSRLSSVKLKLLSQIVVQGIIKPPIELSKAEKLFTDSKLVNPLDKVTAEVDRSVNCVVLDLTIDGKSEKVTMIPFTLNLLLEELTQIREKVVQLNDNPM
ncbi:COMM domain-containing protein 4, partial [Asbolus verrucosus]